MKKNYTLKLAGLTVAVSTLLAACSQPLAKQSNVSQPVQNLTQAASQAANTVADKASSLADKATNLANKAVDAVTSVGNQQFNYSGSLSGAETRVYQFTAQKGQLVRVVRANTSQKIEVNLRYVGNDAAAQNQVLKGDNQVLPATGTYELVVSQSRNDARNQPTAQVPYNLQVLVENVATATSTNATVNYVCDNGTRLNVSYSGNKATLNLKGTSQTLTLNSQYGGSDNPVFTNGKYMLSVGTPSVGNYQQSEVYSVLSFEKSKEGTAFLQNCQVK